MKAALAAIPATVVLLVGWFSAGGSALADPASPAPKPPAAPKTVIDADGSYVVGTDIAPGTYRSDGPVEGKACYFKRLRGDEVVDSALTKQPQVIQIEPTDTVFKTDRCQPWQLAQCPPTCAPSADQHAGLPDVLKGFLPQPKPPTSGAGGG